ncbi:MAG: exodeoxyribonuclease V subunit gamma [Rhodobacterales bacterium]|nr:exodeoxyribonuclease V subunit gamma [Rhodobacterales bacterium]
MLNIYRSNRIEVLVAYLAALLDQPDQRPADPFKPLQVVVGSQGMERFLRHELASQLAGRICANVKFPFPAHIQSEALRVMEQGTSTEPLWNPELATWTLLDVLPELLSSDDARLDPLRAYVGDVQGPVTAKTWSLARRLGDLLDRYVHFRPELAVRWSDGDQGLGDASGADDLAWQPLLWQAISRRIGSKNHFSARWLSAFKSWDVSQQLFDQPVRFFGVTHLPPPFLQQLADISRTTDVDLFVLCPSDAFWGYVEKVPVSVREQLLVIDREEVAETLRESAEAPTSHPILASLGRLGRDLQLTLEAVDQGYVNKSDHDWFIDPRSDEVQASALCHLQSDILNLRNPLGGAEPHPLGADDDSIQIHACFGPARQVEALREVLLHLFESHPHLEPRDVLVITPDIETYAPLVSGVFQSGHDQPLGTHPARRWGRAGAPRIPFEIAQRSMRRTNPVAEVLLQVLILATPGQRLTATGLLDLLAIEPFRDRFGIGADDLSQIRNWVQDSGFRWAVDAEDRARHQQPEVEQNTLSFALERLVLGVCMTDSPGRIYDTGPADLGVVPHDALEGGLAGLLGRFLDAATTLIDEVDAMRAPRPGHAWITRILGDPLAQPGPPVALGTLGRLTATTATSGWLDQRVRVAIQAFESGVVQSKSTCLVETLAMHTALSDQFEVAHGAIRAQTGAVTFASMSPFRSVPFPVVCLLGMDEGTFPANPDQLMFDLTQRHPKVGDRDARDEDRHLLLEALLAAREHLVILHTGRDVNTNEERAPAVPIGELCEVLDHSFATVSGRPASQELTRHHSLHTFSPGNFLPGNPWSFDQRQAEGANLSLNRHRVAPTFFGAVQPSALRVPVSPKPVLYLSLSELIWFFRNPAQTLMNNGFGVYLKERDDALADREPIEVGDLDRYQLCVRMLDAKMGALATEWCSGKAPEVTNVGRVLAEGILPLGSAGLDWLSAPGLLVDEMTALMAPWIRPHDSLTGPDPSVTLALEFQLPDVTVRLSGEVSNRWGRDQLFVAVGDNKAKTLIEPWLTQVAWAAMDGRDVTASVLVHGKLKRDRSAETSVHSLSFMSLATADVRRAGALDYLSQAIQLYRRGLRDRVPFFCACSFAFASTLDAHQTGRSKGMALPIQALDGDRPFDATTAACAEVALGSALKAWEGRDQRGEGYDAHARRLWDDRHPLHDSGTFDLEFGRLARWFWQPAFDGRNKKPQPLDRSSVEAT